MSDENTGADSSSNQTIPKSRLDEVIAERNQERQERAFLQQTLAQLVQNQRAQTARPVEAEDPAMEELKNSNPALYHKVKQQHRDLQQVRAGYFDVNDRLDRNEFFQLAGKDGSKKLAQVEEVLNRERQAGNFKATRHGIYQWLLGQEKLREAHEAANRPAPAPNAPAPKAAAPENDAPSSDPSLATTLQGGKAAVGSVVEKTREERIAALANETF